MACALRRNVKGQAYRHKPKKRSYKPLPDDPNRLGLDPFTPHDLRRTAMTLMAQCGVPFEHRERVANHSMGKMDKIYNKHHFDKEKESALESLTKRIVTICGLRLRPAFTRVNGKTQVIVYPKGTPLYSIAKPLLYDHDDE